MYIICSDAGLPLREELAKSPQKILSSAFPQFFPKLEESKSPSAPSMGEEGAVSQTENFTSSSHTALGSSSEAYFHGLALVSTMVKLMPDWLQANRVVFDTLVLVWKSPARMARLQNEQELSLVQVSFNCSSSHFLICGFVCYSSDVQMFVLSSSMLFICL